MTIYPSWAGQIALLGAEKNTITTEYSDFADGFSKKLAAKFLERFDINKKAINLKPYKQSPYIPIYNLEPVKFETSKTYIKTNLANNFNYLSKSPAGAPILFVHKLNSNFSLIMDYQCPNNLIIKN